MFAPSSPVLPHRVIWPYVALSLGVLIALLLWLIYLTLSPAVIKVPMVGGQGVVPDLSIRHVISPQFDVLDTRGKDWIGEGIVESKRDASQVLSLVTSSGAEERFDVRVKNVGMVAGTITVALSQPTVGWASQFLDTQGRPILSKASTAWTTPVLNPGQEVVLRLQTRAGQGIIIPSSLHVTGQASGGKDVMGLDQQVQHIERLEWSLDGDKWSPVTSTSFVQIQRYATLGMRAIKAFPAFSWGAIGVLGPKWRLQDHNVEGDPVWLQATHTSLAGTLASATLGNTKSLRVSVLPALYLSLDADSGQALVNPGAKETLPVNMTVKACDEDDKPLIKTKVRLRSSRGDNPVFSQWMVPGDRRVAQEKEVFFFTDEQGEIHIEWWVASTAANAGEKITVKAEAMDDSNHPYGDDDSFDFTVVQAQTN